MSGDIVAYAYNGWLESVKREIEKRENINQFWTFKDGSRWTALMAAAYRGENSEIVEYLLKQGADFTLIDNEGRNALHIACRYNAKDSNISLLSDAMRNTDSINQKNNEGKTPLDIVLMHRHTHTRRASYDKRNKWYWVRTLYWNGGRSNFYTFDIAKVHSLQYVGEGRGNLNDVLKSDKPADGKEKDKESKESNDAAPEVALVTDRKLKF